MSAFDLTSNPMGDFPPTAQSTPVVNRRQPHHQADQAAAASSMLTTPNSTALDISGVNGRSYHSLRESPPRGTHKLSDAPRTPTPFKKALADVYQRREPLSQTVRVKKYSVCN